ncbi:MAG: hypothetical protein Q4C12_03515 [Clostridia bacterium]|nr:hypothetical protein [Clostridia bacterium]
MTKLYIILLSALLLLCGCSQTNFVTKIEFTAEDNLEQCAEIISNRLSYMGYKNKIEVLNNKIIAWLNSTSDIQLLKDVLSTKGDFLISLSEEPLFVKTDDGFGAAGITADVFNTKVTRSDIKRVKTVKSNGDLESYIELTFTAAGKEKITELSDFASKSGYGLIIALDDKYYQAPVASTLETDTFILDKFAGEDAFTEKTAKMYAAVISCGELPCELK